MAGKGFPPKPPGARARRNRNGAAQRIPREIAAQPRLPKTMPDGEPWPRATRTWWARWRSSALAAGFSDLEWSELMVAALLHGHVWRGDLKVAGELRLRVSKFGVTAEDRLRLHLEFDDEPTSSPSSPERRSGLRLVDGS